MPSLVEIGPVVLEKKIFKRCQFIFINSQLSPLWEGRGILFELESPSPKDTLCQFWLNKPSGSGEEDENVKSLQTDRQTDGRTDGQTDDGRQVIRKAHLSFQLR